MIPTASALVCADAPGGVAAGTCASFSTDEAEAVEGMLINLKEQVCGFAVVDCCCCSFTESPNTCAHCQAVSKVPCR